MDGRLHPFAMARLLLRALSAALLLPVCSAQVAVRVLGPQGQVPPGEVRVFGTAQGVGELTLGERRIAVAGDGTWETTLELGLGDHALRFGTTGATETTIHHVLVLEPRKGMDARPVLRVDSADAFVAALGPSRILVLAPGEHDLARTSSTVLPPGVERREGTLNLVLSEIDDLDVVGAADGTTTLLTSAAAGTTLILTECQRVNLTSLVLAHRPIAVEGETELPEKSLGGVLAFRRTYNTWLRACRLTGEGVAISVTKINAFVCQDSTIEGCTGGVLDTTNSKHMTFLDSRFVDNGRGRPGDLCVRIGGGERRDIDFLRVALRGNRPGPGTGLFELDAGQVQVLFEDGEILDNAAEALSSGAGKALFKVTGSKVQEF